MITYAENKRKIADKNTGAVWVCSNVAIEFLLALRNLVL